MKSFADIFQLLKRTFIVFAALAQFAPANLAVAADDGDFKIVICTPEGQSLVSWADLTGEPAPFKNTSDHQGNADCDACVGCCRMGPTDFMAGSSFPNLDVVYADYALPHSVNPKLLTHIGPAKPSRAPPVLI